MRHFSSTLQMRNLNSERESDLSKVLWLLSESNRAWPQVSWALTHCSFYPFGLFPGPLHGSFWNDVLLTCLLPLSCCKTSSLNPVVCLEPIFQCGLLGTNISKELMQLKCFGSLFLSVKKTSCHSCASSHAFPVGHKLDSSQRQELIANSTIMILFTYKSNVNR